MEKPNPTSLSAQILTAIIAIILVLMPVHALMTVGLSQLVENYTLLRLWKEFLLLVAVGLTVWLLWKLPDLRRELYKAVLLRVSIAYLGIVLIWSGVASVFSTATPKALGYGLISDSRFVIFLIVCLVASRVSTGLYRQRYVLALGPAGLVVAFGLLQQFILPNDMLKHVGYGPDTIRPFQRIDKKDEYIRIISTLRGANPLGAYLVVILSLLSTLIRQRMALVPVAMVATLSVLFASHSRSSWLGAIVVFAILTLLMIPRRYLKPVLMAGIISAFVFCVGIYIGRDNNLIQNTLFHTDETSQSENSSNDARLGSIQTGMSDILQEPWGQGVGTAGPASVYNSGNEGRIAENYYLQIGQEMGVLGLAVFISLQAIVAAELLRLYRREGDMFALGLFAAFLGLFVVNILNHAWADDTLAYVFWGLAGIALHKTELISWKWSLRGQNIN